MEDIVLKLNLPKLVQHTSFKFMINLNVHIKFIDEFMFIKVHEPMDFVHNMTSLVMVYYNRCHGINKNLLKLIKYRAYNNSECISYHLCSYSLQSVNV